MVKQAYELVPELQAIPLDFAMRAMEYSCPPRMLGKVNAGGLRIILSGRVMVPAVVRQTIHRAV
jgi:hypothetical protein